MTGLNHATQDSTGSNNFDFPNPSSPSAGPSSPTPFPNQNPKPSEPEAAAPQASAANLPPEAGSRKPEAALTQNPDNPDNPNTSREAGNHMKNQQHRPVRIIPISSPEFFRHPDIQARRARALSAIWQDAGVAAEESHRLGGCSMVSLREAALPRPYDRGFHGETPCRALAASCIFGNALMADLAVLRGDGRHLAMCLAVGRGDTE